MTSRFPLAQVGVYRVLVPLGTRGVEIALASEDGPGSFRQFVRLHVARKASLGFAQSAVELAQQAEAGERLDHPNVLRVLRFFAVQEGHVLVLEHLGGATLAELLEAARSSGERWSDDAILQIGAAVCRALAHARAKADAADGPMSIAHGAFDAHAVHLGRDGAIKLAGLGRRDLTEGTDRAAVGRLLWQLLARRPSTALDQPLATVRYDLPLEVSAVIAAARAPGPPSVGLEQLAAWLDKCSSAARAREEIARRVSDHASAQQAVLRRPPANLPPRAPFLQRVRQANVAGTAFVLTVGVVAFTGGRLSRRDVAPVNGASVAASANATALTPAPAIANTAPSVDEPDTRSEAPAPPASVPASTFGWLTVHSPMRSAYVYLHLLRSGRVDQPIPVACGKRFVSLGLPNKHGREPTWLAPSQYVHVPCGGQAETLIVPRSAQRRGR